MNPKDTTIIIDELGEAYLDWLSHLNWQRGSPAWKPPEVYNMYERRHYIDTINWMTFGWMPTLIEGLRKQVPEANKEALAGVAGQIVVSLGRAAADRFEADSPTFNPQRFEEQFLKAVRSAIHKELDK